MKPSGVREKAYIYVRVSTPEQVDGDSLSVQEKACLSYAEHVLHADVIRVYKEEGESAKSANRTQLNKMINDAITEKGSVDYVVVYDMSRASRDVASYYAIIKCQLNKLGIKIRSVIEPTVDETPFGEFSEILSLAYAQLENRMKAVKVKASMGERAKQGYWITQPPLGFKIKIVLPDGRLTDSLGRKERVKYPKVLVPDDRTLAESGLSIADAVTKVLTDFANSDMSETEAHKLAMKLGLKAIDGRPLPFNSLHHMLEHPVYAGYSKPGKALGESTKLKFDGLISKDTFNLIQSKLAERKRELKPKDKGLYPLDDTILCCHEHCNMPLHGDAPGNGSKKHPPRYYCRGGIKRGHGYESAKASEIHVLFNDFLQQLAPTDGAIRLFKEVLKRTAAQKLGNANAELKTLADAEQRLSDKKKATLDLLLVGKITAEEKDFMMAEVEKEREQCRLRRKELEEQQELNELTIEYVCNFISQPAKLWRDADLESKRALQKLLFPNGLHVDLKAKKCRTEDLSPLYSVVCNKKEPSGSNSGDMVNLVYTNWNYLVSDFYRIKGIATVLYPTSYIPSVSRTGSY